MTKKTVTEETETETVSTEAEETPVEAVTVTVTEAAPVVVAPVLTRVRVKIGSLMFEKGVAGKGTEMDVTDEELARFSPYVEIIK
jgi:hypothetical protein